MRFNQKKRLIQAIGTMQEAHDLIIQQCQIKPVEELYEMLIQLQEMAIQIGNVVEADKGFPRQIIEGLEGYCERLYECSVELENSNFVIDCNISMLRCLEEIEDLVRGIMSKIKVAFFPYKYSMWDSLESIWIAAAKDENCECQVVPIPYYTKDEDGKFSQSHYEGTDFARVCPIMDYRTYFLEEEQPDIMYIHNPYDQYNKVTMVESRFFSGELKKYGGLLVYVPYYLSGCCIKYENLDIAYAKGAINSNFIILQSEALKEAYRFWGFPEERLLALGSPKIDAVQKLSQKKLVLNEEWKRVLNGKKVILLNTSIGSFLNDGDWLLKLKENVLKIIEENGLALVWRPHPLLYDTIKALGQDREEQYWEIIRIITEAENALVDESCDAATAMKVSDAMISDYSSLVLQYTFTGKPAFLWSGSSKERPGFVFCDFFGNYFMQDGISLKEFLDMVQSGKDPKKEERLRAAAAGIENTDGTCGEKVHEAICRKLML